jgi:DNA-directed RNA polymerase subunit M/transcription elongation factor TFIIS
MADEPKHIEEGKCPACGSENITYDTGMPQDDDMVYPVSCDDCECLWHEVYEVKFIGIRLNNEFHGV